MESISGYRHLLVPNHNQTGILLYILKNESENESEHEVSLSKFASALPSQT